MIVFWENGYDATTTDHLLAGMQLTRGSLYKAFGDKKALFLKTLDLYDAQEVDRAVDVLSDPERAGPERIMALFTSITAAVDAGNRMGCLLCSTLSGLSANDPDISPKLLTSAAKLHQGFETALNKIPGTPFPESYAHLLVTQYVGLRVLSRTGVPASSIHEGVAAIGAVLRQ